MRSASISLGSLVIILIASCGIRYEIFTSYDVDPWNHSYEKSFYFDVMAGSYAADLIVDHDIDYGFENLYLVIETQSESLLQSIRSLFSLLMRMDYGLENAIAQLVHIQSDWLQE